MMTFVQQQACMAHDHACIFQEAYLKTPYFIQLLDMHCPFTWLEFSWLAAAAAAAAAAATGLEPGNAGKSS